MNPKHMEQDTHLQQQSTAGILDGLKASEAFISAVRAAINEHVLAGGRRPGLAVVLVGTDPASSIYVRAKRRDSERAGIMARDIDLAASTTQQELLQLIDQLNEDPEIDGILVQLPLPRHIDEIQVTNRINPNKDVDGFHAFNVGKLALRQPGLRPCTPRGIMALLSFHGVEVRARHAVVVGASNIVGRPMSLELLYTGATVTVTHRFTKNLEKHVRNAELLISAIGKRGIVDSNWIQPGAVVVDVGINRLPDGRITGDIDFDTAARRAAWISPVPGGVGPMTRATLMLNTAEAAGLQVPLPCKPHSTG
ncbi:MAG TPA: bifunctional methylenetetrahydrofolate dehydrogenase/methenyltetrahydrofolate cyclohydrolase FolD [Xanthomonadales bacterium]|nr:bifunctional methylenetetrahydrofolate dehydrogenase/methenyltetrahydrofolate cyclohydrolase FolD [Xanthomonadales bacterium]